MAHDDGLAGDRVLAHVAFAFDIAGVDAPWTVSRAVVRERLCAPFEASVVVAAPVTASPAALLGKPCELALHRDALTRRFAGVVTAVEDLGVNRESRVFEVSFAPTLALLATSARYRIWQRADALRVVRDVLDAAELYRGGAFTTDLSAGADVPAPREYCVQFGESDLDFVRRLLAEEGLLFTFDATDAGETLAVFDARGASGCPATPTASPGPIPIHVEGNRAVPEEGIRRLDVVTAVTTNHVSLRDYDFTHPRAPLTSAEPAATHSVERYPGPFVLGAYADGPHQYGAPDMRRTARIELQQHTAQAEIVRGEGSVTGMRPGTTFAVVEGGDRGLAGTFLLTAVLHIGHAPDATMADTRGALDLDRYRNTFECVPVGRPWAAPPVPRPRADHPQVALVTAETGSDDEIYTDHYGRVLVRFPWDRPELRRPPRAGHRTSCWLRVMQPWAGTNWGFHFTPRVGMEVVVHFVDGDPERPYVAGCLPNAVNVPPVELPVHKTQSTIRTQSSPANGGFNELRFEDAAAHEEVYLRAQRDWVSEVLHDRTLSVGHDETMRVRRDSTETVGRNRRISVDGAETHVVVKKRQVSVGDDQLVEVVGNASLIVQKTVTTHADESWRTTANDVGSLEVGGGSGTALQMTPDEVQTRAPKKVTVAVGDDVASVMTTEALAVKAPKRIALACGETHIVIEEDKIELVTKSGAKVVLDGDKIDVIAGGVVKIKGSEVKSNG